MSGHPHPFPRFASPPRPAGARRRPGLTLVELLTVMVIISILAAITISIAGIVVKKQSLAKASTQMDALMTYLKAFQSANLDYPPMDNDLGSGSPYAEQNLLAALTGHARWIRDPLTGLPKWEMVPMSVTMNDQSILPFGEVYNWGVAYIKNLDDFDYEHDTTTPSGIKDNTVLNDPWGNPYLYRYMTVKESYTPATRNWQSMTPILVSRGPDGEPADPESNFVWKSVQNHTQYSGVLTDEYSDPDKNPLLKDNLVRSAGQNLP